jgi:hypothetical protein
MAAAENKLFFSNVLKVIQNNILLFSCRLVRNISVVYEYAKKIHKYVVLKVKIRSKRLMSHT